MFGRQEPVGIFVMGFFFNLTLFLNVCVDAVNSHCGLGFSFVCVSVCTALGYAYLFC